MPRHEPVCRFAEHRARRPVGCRAGRLRRHAVHRHRAPQGTSPASPTISLIRRDNGTVAVRLELTYDCRNYADTSKVMRATARLNGANFRVSTRARIRGMGTIRVRVTGTVAEASVTGQARIQISDCFKATRPFVLRTDSAPAGAPAVPAPGTLMQGMSSQTAAGFRLPVVVRVAKNGRAYALWSATVRCRGGSFSMLDQTPSRKIAADGTFGGSQTYRVRYKGVDEVYRVSFRGQFLADGVRGTLTASMRFSDGKNRYIPCRSGRQTWAARAT